MLFLCAVALLLFRRTKRRNDDDDSFDDDEISGSFPKLDYGAQGDALDGQEDSFNGASATVQESLVTQTNDSDASVDHYPPTFDDGDVRAESEVSSIAQEDGSDHVTSLEDDSPTDRALRDADDSEGSPDFQQQDEESVGVSPATEVQVAAVIDAEASVSENAGSQNRNIFNAHDKEESPDSAEAVHSPVLSVDSDSHTVKETEACNEAQAPYSPLKASDDAYSRPIDNGIVEEDKQSFLEETPVDEQPPSVEESSPHCGANGTEV